MRTKRKSNPVCVVLFSVCSLCKKKLSSVFVANIEKRRLWFSTKPKFVYCIYFKCYVYTCILCLDIPLFLKYPSRNFFTSSLKRIYLTLTCIFYFDQTVKRENHISMSVWLVCWPESRCCLLQLLSQFISSAPITSSWLWRL